MQPWSSLLILSIFHSSGQGVCLNKLSSLLQVKNCPLSAFLMYTFPLFSSSSVTNSILQRWFIRQFASYSIIFYYSLRAPFQRSIDYLELSVRKNMVYVSQPISKSRKGWNVKSWLSSLSTNSLVCSIPSSDRVNPSKVLMRQPLVLLLNLKIWLVFLLPQSSLSIQSSTVSTKSVLAWTISQYSFSICLNIHKKLICSSSNLLPMILSLSPNYRLQVRIYYRRAKFVDLHYIVQNWSPNIFQALIYYSVVWRD